MFLLISAKLLVTAGYYDGNYVTSSEVIALNSPDVSCQPWMDYPIGVEYAVGGYTNDFVIACGGNSYDFVNDFCFKIEPSKITQINGLQYASQYSGGGILHDSLVVSGGATDTGMHIFITE